MTIMFIPSHQFDQKAPYYVNFRELKFTLVSMEFAFVIFSHVRHTLTTFNFLSGTMALLYFDLDNKVKNIVGYENWCLSKDSRKLLGGDFNGDSYTDLLCHNKTGEMRVLLNMGGNE